MRNKMLERKKLFIPENGDELLPPVTNFGKRREISKGKTRTTLNDHAYHFTIPTKV